MNLIVRPSLVTAPLSMPKSGGAADAMLFDIGMGSASMAIAKRPDMARRRTGALNGIKFTLFNIDDLNALFVVVHYVGQFGALLLHWQQRCKCSNCTGKIVCAQGFGHHLRCTLSV